MVKTSKQHTKEIAKCSNFFSNMLNNAITVLTKFATFLNVLKKKTKK